MPRSSHDAEYQCDVDMQLSTPRQVAGYAIRGPRLRVRECTSLPFRAKPGTASHRICTLVLCPRRINPAPSPRHTTWLPAVPACLSIEHRTSNIDLPRTRPDPHAAARVQPSTPLRGVRLGWFY
jgi:hypothetical protein